jgi:N-acyl homoserine lactone hydrolase
MKKIIDATTAALLLLSTVQVPPTETATPTIELYRLDCGSITVKNLDEFSDTYLYVGQTKTLTVSCYLIRNGEQILLWDTGVDGDLAGTSKDSGGYINTLKKQIVPQLVQIGVKPKDVNFVGISHYHFDHIGQAADFPTATLLIGKKDFAVAKVWKPAQQRLAPWIEGGGNVLELEGDKDVFGDGRVTILSMPGHTEGHQALLVRLASGPVLLSGDQYHFTEQLANRGVPAFNTDRAETLASMDRFDRIAKQLKAKVIIQHEPDDIAKLPTFPKPAK